MNYTLADSVEGCQRGANSYFKSHKGRSRIQKAFKDKGYLVRRINGRLRLLSIDVQGKIFIMR